MSGKEDVRWRRYAKKMTGKEEVGRGRSLEKAQGGVVETMG
jgi:hypothetical protein